MFSKPADPTAPLTRPTTGNLSSNNRSILSSDLRIVGDITSTGTIEVLGDVEGTLSAHGLVIGGEGTVVLGKAGYAFTPAVTNIFGTTPESPRYNQISGTVEIEGGTVKLLGYGALGTASLSITGETTIFIDGNGGQLTLTPKEDGSGWY